MFGEKEAGAFLGRRHRKVVGMENAGDNHSPRRFSTSAAPANPIPIHPVLLFLGSIFLLDIFQNVTGLAPQNLTNGIQRAKADGFYLARF